MKVMKLAVVCVLMCLFGCGKVYQINPIVNFYETGDKSSTIWMEKPSYCYLSLWLYCSEENYNEFINPYKFNPLKKNKTLYEVASSSNLNLKIHPDNVCKVFSNVSTSGNRTKDVYKDIFKQYTSLYPKEHFSKRCKDDETNKVQLAENMTNAAKYVLLNKQYGYNTLSIIRDEKNRAVAIGMLNLEPAYKINYYIFKELFADLMSFDLVGDIEEARNARNLLQSAIMGVSDRALGKHLSSVKATQVNVNLLLGLTTTGLTGYGAVAAEATGKALSAAATGTNSARSMISDQVYRDALAETLVNSIITNRLEMKKGIEIKQEKSVADYNVEAAISDALDYHEKGSFYYGLTLIRVSAEQANTARITLIEQDRKNQLEILSIQSGIALQKKKNELANEKLKETKTTP